MPQRPVWRDVLVVLFFMGPWAPASFLLVKALRALELVQDEMLAAIPDLQNIHRSAEGSLCQAAHIGYELLHCSECLAKPQERDEEGRSYFLGTWKI